jgi:hypothetical protein
LPADNLAVIDRPVLSTHWRTYAVEVDVPSNAHSIVISCALAGNCTAWFGDLILDVC